MSEQRHRSKKPDEARAMGDLALCLRVMREARPYCGGMCLFFLVSLLAAPVALLAPVPLKIAVDSGLGDTPLPPLLVRILPGALTEGPLAVILLSAILVVLFRLIAQTQSAANSLIRTILSEQMILDFRAKLFRHVQRLSFAFHDRRGSSDSTYRILWDAASIQYITIDGVIPFVSSIITLGAMIMITFAVNWQLGLVALAISPVLAGLALFFRPRLRRSAK
ncbi:MAG: hypothetical protein RLZZ522_997, partial [Verrucomicrobiota bacterium]